RKRIAVLPNSDWVRHISTTSYDVMWDWDLSTGEIYVGESVQQVFGYKILGNRVAYANCWKLIFWENRQRVEMRLQGMLDSPLMSWTDKFSFRNADGTFANVVARAAIIRDEDGVAIRMIGAMQDISKIMELEEIIRKLTIDKVSLAKGNAQKQLHLVDQLADEILSRELGIASAVVDAQEVLRGDLGPELHDTVTQLLGASQLYLDLARSQEGDVSTYLLQSETYTRSAIKAIRELSKDLTSNEIADFGLYPAIDQLVMDTMQVQPMKIHFLIDPLLDQNLNLKCKLNIFRMIQEQVNNICKHAHAGNVNIQLSQNKFSFILTVTDDGVGFDVHQQKKGIGLSNIRSRSALYNGAVNVVSQIGEGCTIRVIFPLNNILFVSVA
ncbi:MAG: ATP-binding protein, partial [Flavitalea sp.]